MTIGRTDDPENPSRSMAFEAAGLFGVGSRNPSGPADMCAASTGRTHDRNRTACQTSRFFSCILGAVHTCPGDLFRHHAAIGPPDTPGDDAVIVGRRQY